MRERNSCDPPRLEPEYRHIGGQAARETQVKKDFAITVVDEKKIASVAALELNQRSRAHPREPGLGDLSAPQRNGRIVSAYRRSSRAVGQRFVLADETPV
jgi:hypothetical protein